MCSIFGCPSPSQGEHGVCCGGVPRARAKPARWGDAHPGTVASEPSREHIIGMRMAMMPTSRCCPSPPSPLQPCNCKSNALKSQRRALAPFDFLARSPHSAPCRKPRLHPTYTPRPAIRRARRLQKCKATPPQKSMLSLACWRHRGGGAAPRLHLRSWPIHGLPRGCRGR